MLVKKQSKNKAGCSWPTCRIACIIGTLVHDTSCSSRMRVMNHNWSATKQRLHPQSVAEISRHSVSLGDKIRHARHHLRLAKRTQISVCTSPLPSAGTVVSLFRAKMVGRSKPSCRIVGSHTRWELTTLADFQLCLHRLFMSTGCKSSYNGFLDVSSSNGGLRISGWIGQLSCLMIFSTSLSVAAFLRRAGSQCWRAQEAMGEV